MILRFTGVHRGRFLSFLIAAAVSMSALLAAAPPAAAMENWFEQGLTDLKEGRYQAAADKFSLAIEAMPEDYEAFNNRGFARIYIGDYEGAIADCSRSIAIHPGSAKAYNNRGFARLFTNDLDAAIADFDQALAINPRYVDAYSNRCLGRTQQGDFAEAVADCTEALHLNPRSAKALYNRGYARDRQGHPGAAMRDYIQALKVNPAYIEVFNNMAWIMATSPDERLRDGRRAVAYAEKAVGSAPDINFLDTLAAAYAEAGRFDEAVAIENRIISLLASARHSGSIPLHVKRMSLYEEGRPYREAIAIQPVSAVIDLESELTSLDKLVFTPEVSTVAYEPAEAARNLTAEAAEATRAPAARPSTASETENALTVPQAYSQSIQTSPGVPVEISLAAEPEGIPLTFEIETVPYQGALQGTLPNLLYTPRPGFEGVDRFTFRARNAAGASNLATVTIAVTEPPPETGPEVPGAAPAAPEMTTEAPQPEQPKAAPSPEPAPLAGVPSEADEAPLEAADAEPAGPAQAPAESSAAPVVAPPGEDEAEVEAADEAATAPSAPGTAPVENLAVSTETVPESELSSDAVYTIQVYSVKEAEDAAKLVANLSQEGYAAFSLAVEVPEKGQWHRVFIDGYPSMAAAREGLAQLDGERFKDAFIRRMPDGVRLPVAAPAPQVALPAAAPAAEPAPPAETRDPDVAAPAPPPPAAPNVPAEAPTPEPTMPAEAPAPEPRTPAEAQPEADSAEQQAIPVADKTYPFAYQVKAYKEREEAFQLAVELTSQGHTAFIGRGAIGSTGEWYRIYIGCYQTPEEAEKHRSDIIRAGFPDAFLTPVPLAIVVRPDESDPAGEHLESRLLASGFLPYRLPQRNPDGTPIILVGGFRQSEDAARVLAALEQSGFKGEIRPR